MVPRDLACNSMRLDQYPYLKFTDNEDAIIHTLHWVSRHISQGHIPQHSGQTYRPQPPLLLHKLKVPVSLTWAPNASMFMTSFSAWVARYISVSGSVFKRRDVSYRQHPMSQTGQAPTHLAHRKFLVYHILGSLGRVAPLISFKDRNLISVLVILRIFSTCCHRQWYCEFAKQVHVILPSSGVQRSGALRLGYLAGYQYYLANETMMWLYLLSKEKLGLGMSPISFESVKSRPKDTESPKG